MSSTIDAMLETLQEIKSDGSDDAETATDGGSSASLLDMILTYSEVDEASLDDVYDSSISINSAGERMEYFVKDLLADSLDEESADDKTAAHRKVLSWLGSQNHPPDLMIRGAEAIEVKKSRGKHSKLQLNSSTPRTSLRADMKRVNDDCTSCEDEIGGWTEKDMVYVLGSRVTKSSVGFMWVVYGDCWCDDSDVYASVTDDLEDAIEQSPPDNGSLETGGNELAKVKDVGDGMGAELRARPMWSIEHPAKKFSQYVDNYEQKLDDGQPMFTVMPEDRFEQAPARKREALESNDDVSITHVESEDCYIIEAE